MEKKTRDWWNTIRIGKEKDGRIKLTDEDKAQIKILYEQGNSIRKIADIFKDKCSRRLIQFVLFPERLQQVRLNYKARGGWKIYYSKEKRKYEMRNYRKKIKSIYKTKPVEK